VDSAEFRRRAPRVELSDDSDTATVQTVRAMCDQIKTASNDPLVRRAALSAALHFKGGPLRSAVAMTDAQMRADSCWWWCKHFLRFKHHSTMFEAWSSELGDPHRKLQLLISPDVLVRMRSMEGDCAIYTMMICAMLRALGLPYQIMTLAVDPSQPDVMTHVCARVVLPDGVETLDASHGQYPGWQVPAEHTMRLWVFDANGKLTEEKQGPMFSGLHAYRPRRFRARVRGMGAMVCDESGCYDDGTGTSSGIDLSQYYPLGTSITPGTVPVTAATPGAPAGGFNTTAFFGNLANAWTKIAGQVIAPQQTISRGPGGQLLITGPASANIPTAGAALLGSASSWLLPVGLIAVGLVAISMLKK